jgi:hypothetical protein
MGITTQRTPVSRTTSACSRNLGSAELIAVSVTIVRMASRLIIRRSGPGRCQAPRTSCPGATTRTRFSNQVSRCKAKYSPAPRPKASTKLQNRIGASPRFTRRTFLGSQLSRSADINSLQPYLEPACSLHSGRQHLRGRPWRPDGIMRARLYPAGPFRQPQHRGRSNPVRI